jgi:hypothetical protein
MSHVTETKPGWGISIFIVNVLEGLKHHLTTGSDGDKTTSTIIRIIPIMPPVCIITPSQGRPVGTIGGYGYGIGNVYLGIEDTEIELGLC